MALNNVTNTFNNAETTEINNIFARKKIGVQGRLFSKSSVSNTSPKKPWMAFKLLRQRLYDFALIPSVFKKARLESERAFGQAALGTLIHQEDQTANRSVEELTTAVAGHLDFEAQNNQTSRVVWNNFAKSRQAKKCIGHADFMFTHPDQFTGATKGLIKLSRTLSNLGDVLLIRYIGLAKALRALITGDQTSQNLARGPAMALAVYVLDVAVAQGIGKVGLVSGGMLMGAIMGGLWVGAGLSLQAAQALQAFKSRNGLSESHANTAIELAQRSAREQLNTAAKVSNYLESQKAVEQDFNVSQEIATTYVARKANDYERTLTCQLNRIGNNKNIGSRTIPRSIHAKSALDLVKKDLNSQTESSAELVLRTLVANYKEGAERIGAAQETDRADIATQPLIGTPAGKQHEKAAKYSVLGLKHVLDMIGGTTANTLQNSASYEVGTLSAPQAWRDANPDIPLALNSIKPCDKTNNHYAIQTLDKVAFRLRQNICYRLALAFSGMARTDLSKSVTACKRNEDGSLVLNNGKPVPEYSKVQRGLHRAARYLSTNANEVAGRTDLKKAFANPKPTTYAHAMQNPHQYGRVSRSLRFVVDKSMAFSEKVSQFAISQFSRVINSTVMSNFSNNSSRVLGNRYGFAASTAGFLAMAPFVPPIFAVGSIFLAIYLSGPAIGMAVAPLVFVSSAMLAASSSFDYKGDISKPVQPKYGA